MNSHRENLYSCQCSLCFSHKSQECNFWALAVVELSTERTASFHTQTVQSFLSTVKVSMKGSSLVSSLSHTLLKIPGMEEPVLKRETWKMNWEVTYLHHRRRSSPTALWSRHGGVFLWLAEFHSWLWEVHTSKLSLDFCLASESGQCEIRIRDYDTGQTLEFQKSGYTFQRYFHVILILKSVYFTVPMSVLCWFKVFLWHFRVFIFIGSKLWFR
jgi:hypothetical protein